MKHSKDFWHQLANHCGYNVRAMARHLGITLRQLERLCQQDLQLTPRELLWGARMHIAADLLVKGHTIKSVALELGYIYLPNFSRAFRLFFGLTPREYIARFCPLPGHPGGPPDLPGLAPVPRPPRPLGPGPAGVAAREFPRPPADPVETTNPH